MTQLIFLKKEMGKVQFSDVVSLKHELRNFEKILNGNRKSDVPDEGVNFVDEF